MGQVTTSLVVNFDSSQGGVLQAEIDGRPTGLNKGRTSFQGGDTPYFLVFRSSDVVIDSITPSHGSIALVGTGVYQVQEDVQFADVVEGSLQKPFYNSPVYKWLGNNLGVPVLKESKVVVPTQGVGVLRLTYNALYAAYRLDGIPETLAGETAFSVLIVIKGHN